MSDVRQEPDMVPGKLVIGILVIALAISAVLIVVTWFIADWKSDRRVPGSSEARLEQLRPPEINEMEVSLFDDPQPGLERHEQAQRRLEQYGWADPERETVNIPIDRAIELWLARQRGDRGDRGRQPRGDPQRRGRGTRPGGEQP